MSTQARKILDEAESDAHAAEAHARNAAMHSTLAREQIDKARAALESVPEREAARRTTLPPPPIINQTTPDEELRAMIAVEKECGGVGTVSILARQLLDARRLLRWQREVMVAIDGDDLLPADPLADRPKECSCYKPRMALGGPHDMGCPLYSAPDPKLAEDVKALVKAYADDGGTQYARVRAAELRDFYRRVFAAELGE